MKSTRRPKSPTTSFTSDFEALQSVVIAIYRLSRPLTPTPQPARPQSRSKNKPKTRPSPTSAPSLREAVVQLAAYARQVREWLLAAPDKWRNAGSPLRPGGARHLPADVDHVLRQLEDAESTLAAPEPLTRLDFIGLILERRIQGIIEADERDKRWRSFTPRTEPRPHHPPPSKDLAYPLVHALLVGLTDFTDDIAQLIFILANLPDRLHDQDGTRRRPRYHLPTRDPGERHFEALQEKRWQHLVTSPEDRHLFDEYDWYHEARLQILAAKPAVQAAVDAAALFIDKDTPESLDRVSFQVRRAITDACDALPNHAFIGDAPPSDCDELVKNLQAARATLHDLRRHIRPMAECTLPDQRLKDGEAANQADLEVSDDYDRIILNGVEYRFKGQSRQIVVALFKRARLDDLGLTLREIKRIVDSDATRFRPEMPFRIKGKSKNPALGVLIERHLDGLRIAPAVAQMWRAKSPTAHQ